MGLGKIVRGKTFKNFMAKLYGFGASVVIIGALFKINHYPGANEMLIIGLGTEALIFFFSAFEPPHVEPDWSLVYPELAGLYHEDGKSGKRGMNKGGNSQALDILLDQAKVGPDLIENLGKGLKNLSDSTNKLNDITDASVVTNEYLKNVKEASQSVNQLSQAYRATSESLTTDVDVSKEYLENVKKASSTASQLSEIYAETGSTIKEGGDLYGTTLKKVTGNLSALNAIYETQLKGSESQINANEQLQKTLDSFLANLSSSADITAQYKTEVDVLAKRVAALNQVYGNMLSAMNVKS